MALHRIRIAAALAVMLLLMAACAPRPAGTATPAPASTPTLQAGQTPVPPGVAVADLADAPARDAFHLARRYAGFDGVPLAAEVLYASESIDATRTFWTINPTAPSVGEVEAVVRLVGRHAVWYVATGVDVDDEVIEEAARRFDEEIYPHVLRTFAPGLELPGPIAIVTAPLTAFAGYFTAADALPRAMYPYSNERAGVFMDPRSLGTDTYLGTLAHEFQHVVHWLVSPTEETWVNEGLAEFSARSMGLPALPFNAYLRDPEVSLVHWPDEIGVALPNYAGGALFISYLVHLTGAEHLHRLVSQPLDGVSGVRAYLADTLPDLTFEELFADWLAANVIGAAAGRYSYPESPETIEVSGTASGPASGAAQVNQFGAWYMRIEPGSSPLTFQFNGRTATAVLPVVPHSGEHCWWGNRGDSIDSTLTRTLDLSGVNAATLRFWTWHQIEQHWDHGYVSVSTDGGATWTALAGRHTKATNPVGVTHGPSYTGRTDRWLPEVIDLSPYAGNEVLLRFEYVTDEAVSATGWCVDDIEIQEIGFFDDAESPEHDWEADGFVRLSSRGVQQGFVLRLVEGTGDSATVTSIPLDELNHATFVVQRPATLAVTAIAPKTSQPGTFSYAITR